jgi:hypothetical protein
MPGCRSKKCESRSRVGLSPGLSGNCARGQYVLSPVGANLMRCDARHAGFDLICMIIASGIESCPMLCRVSLGFLIIVAWLALACGAGTSGAHIVQSITLSPSSADAQNYPSGKVAFAATGHYDNAPMTVTPMQANWGAESEFMWSGSFTYGSANGAVSVDPNGAAQCAPSASGTYAVVAWVVQYPNVQGTCGSGNSIGEPGCNVVQGMAQLTCP